MKPNAFRGLREPISGYWAANWLVRRVVDQWELGLPIRTANRILRRNGVHPWSLLPAVRRTALPVLATELKAPRWVVDACTEFGIFRFSGLAKGIELPEGLVVHYLAVVDCPHLRRLPRRLWGVLLEVSCCTNLSRLPEGPAQVEKLILEDCPSLGCIPPMLGPSDVIEVRRCASLRHIPLGRGATVAKLVRLPRLATLAPDAKLKLLQLWNCPCLESLGTITVTEGLLIDGCPNLRSLPGFEGVIEGRIRDCPSLEAPLLPMKSPSFEFVALEGPSSRPAPRPVPNIQPFEPYSLPGLTDPSEKEAWPWPPNPSSRLDADDHLDRTARVLGLGTLDRARMLAHRRDDIRLAIRYLLIHTVTPGEAVRVAADMLTQASREGDARAGSAICLELENLGLGSLSAALQVDVDAVQGLAPVLGQGWCDVLRQSYGMLEEMVAGEREVAGPMVICTGASQDRLGNKRAETRFQEFPQLGRLQGPLWVEHSFRLLDCPDLEELPDLMVVEGDLEIVDCPSLWRFPSRLKIGGDLVLGRLPRLVAQVCRVEVHGTIRIDCVPGLTLVQIEETVSDQS